MAGPAPGNQIIKMIRMMMMLMPGCDVGALSVMIPGQSSQHIYKLFSAAAGLAAWLNLNAKDCV